MNGGRRPDRRGSWLRWCAVAWAILVSAGFESGNAFAAGTAVWEMSTFKDFIRGVFKNVALDPEGRLLIGPEAKSLFSSEQPLIWSLAAAPDGSIFLGSGHRGRVYRVDASGKNSVFWAATEPEVFALAPGPDGNLYAGTSPDGKIYKITPSGEAAEFFSPQTKYIWSLVFGPDGSLFAGTGEGGKIFRIDRSGKSEVYYDTKQGHVTSLAFDRSGALLAGTDPNGLLYRIREKGRAFVLYNASLPEIRALEVAADGTIYAAAMGGAVSRMAQAGAAVSAADMLVSPQVTSITVTASADQAEPSLPKAPDSKTAPATAPSPVVPAAPVATPVVSYSGMQKSALLRIAPDDTVETVWTSTEENVYALLPSKDGLLFSTDDHGRIYRLRPDRQVTLLAQTGEGETTRLAAAGKAVVAATSNLGKLYRLGDGPAAEGFYEAPVRDTGTISKWGKLSWKAQVPPGASIEFSTRSGNSLRPDATWSDWSTPLRRQEGEPVASPRARYVQWRAELHSAQGQSPVIESVALAYLPQNSAPVIKSIAVTSAPAPSSKTTAALSPSAGTTSGVADYSITVTETGSVSNTTNAGTNTAVLGRSSGQAQATSISWVAEDPDGDKLTARVSFRGEGESAWKLLKDNITESYLTIDSDALADGVYQVKVAVSDAQSNPREQAREAEMISIPFLIDNTPPVVKTTTVARQGERAVVKFVAEDAASMLRRAEYSLDAGPWMPVFPDDGILDSKQESFSLELDLKPGEHLVVVRVFDNAGNAGLAKAVIR